MDLRSGAGFGGVGEFVIGESVVRGDFAEQPLGLGPRERLRLSARFDLRCQRSMSVRDGPGPVRVVAQPSHPGVKFHPRGGVGLCCEHVGGHGRFLPCFSERVSTLTRIGDPETDDCLTIEDC